MDVKKWKLPLRRIPAQTATGDRSQYWDNAKVIYEQALFGGVSHSSFSPNGKFFGVVSSNHSLVLRLPPTDGAVWSEQASRKVHSLRFRGDGRLVVQTVERRVVIKSTDTAYERQLQGHMRDVHDAAFISNQKLVSAGDDNVVRYWDFVSEEELGHTTKQAHTDYVRSLQVMSDSTFLSGGYDHQVLMWDLRSGLEHPVNSWKLPDQVQAMQYIQHKDLFAAAAADVVSFFDIRAGGKSTSAASNGGAADAVSEALHTASNHTKAVTSLAYIPDRDVVVSGSLDKRMKFLSTASGDNFEVVTTRKCSNPVTSVSASHDGELLAVGDAVGNVQLLEVVELTATRHVEGEASGNIKKEKIFREKTELIRTLLVRHKYNRALQTALYSHQPSVVLSLVEELQKRGALRVAVSGNNDRTIVELLRFATGHIDMPTYTMLCIHLIDVIMEIYGSAATTSEFFHGELLKAAAAVGESLTALERIQQTVGIMELATDLAE